MPAGPLAEGATGRIMKSSMTKQETIAEITRRPRHVRLGGSVWLVVGLGKALSISISPFASTCLARKRAVSPGQIGRAHV